MDQVFQKWNKEEQVSYDFVGSNPTISVKKMILIKIAETTRDFSYERSAIFILTEINKKKGISEFYQKMVERKENICYF